MHVRVVPHGCSRARLAVAQELLRDTLDCLGCGVEQSLAAGLFHDARSALIHTKAVAEEVLEGLVLATGLSLPFVALLDQASCSGSDSENDSGSDLDVQLDTPTLLRYGVSGLACSFSLDLRCVLAAPVGTCWFLDPRYGNSYNCSVGASKVTSSKLQVDVTLDSGVLLRTISSLSNCQRSRIPRLVLDAMNEVKDAHAGGITLRPSFQLSFFDTFR